MGVNSEIVDMLFYTEMTTKLEKYYYFNIFPYQYITFWLSRYGSEGGHRPSPGSPWDCAVSANPKHQCLRQVI